jgi:hypothetical protein
MKLETNAESLTTHWQDWRQRIAAWCQMKKLEMEFRDSEKFQKRCEQIRCFNLAALEEDYRAEIKEKIKRLKSSALIQIRNF